MRLGLIGFGNIATTFLRLAREKNIDITYLCVLTLPECDDQTREGLHHIYGSKNYGITHDHQGVLAAKCDLVIECAGHQAVMAHVPPLLLAGGHVILASIGALADPALEQAVMQSARKGRGKLILPAGAVGGIDLLAGLQAGGPLQVSYRGVKPPLAWMGTPAQDILDLAHLSEATVFFKGTARAAARTYPKNANVAATLALAGAGFEETQVELVADPNATGNRHSYQVMSDIANYTIQIDNLPSAGNAKTSLSTVYSILRAVQNHMGPIAL